MPDSGFLANRLWPIGYVDLRETEPAQKSSNLANKASFAKGSYEKVLSNLKAIYNITPLPSLGEVLTKQRRDELAQAVTEILSSGANVNDASLNGHRPLQLLIRANLEPLKKLAIFCSKLGYKARIIK